MHKIEVPPIEKITREYKRQYQTYDDFSKKIENVLREILQEKKIKFHTITARAKKFDSVKRKLKKKGRQYRFLPDITDLAGVRVTCLVPDDVDKVAKIVETTFKILPKYSIDKRIPEDPTGFGYASFHYVIEIQSKRRALPEWNRFGQLRAEIQIRTLLQHAWAEIEHDVGYNTPYQVPREFRRRFSRLSGLLELADSEFNRLLRDITAYRKEVSKKINTEVTKIPIDRESFKLYYQKPQILNNLDRKIATIIQGSLSSSDDFIEPSIDILAYHKIATFGQLEKNLEQHDSNLQAFVTHWEKPSKGIEIPRGVTIFYLGLFLIGKKSLKEIEEYIERFPILIENKTVHDITREVKNLVNQITPEREGS
ncbi:MAG: hypothetical protein HZB92_02615 [Euryarchaeota archaeon]|nr:hypothetical protein [Euryarchaeota archaeon]